jgi:hypothetical protein
MAKTPKEERLIILSGDARRKYSSRISFEVERSSCMGEIDQVTLLLANGKNAILARKCRSVSGEPNALYFIDVEGYSTAAEAELAGMITAQSLLFTAVSLNFGLRLLYDSHEPPLVRDRTLTRSGFYVGVSTSSYTGWHGEVVTSELIESMQHEQRDRRIFLALERLASSSLERTASARFLKAVSAFEPLAFQENLAPEIAAFVDNVLSDLRDNQSIPDDLRPSLEGRIKDLKRESVSQALRRLCSKWFPDDLKAKKDIESAYRIRSQILHEGRPANLDVSLDREHKIVA